MPLHLSSNGGEIKRRKTKWRKNTGIFIYKSCPRHPKIAKLTIFIVKRLSSIYILCELELLNGELQLTFAMRTT